MTFSGAAGGGGTLTLPSPNHVHRVPSAVRPLRRSISNSPPKPLSRTSSRGSERSATVPVPPSPGPVNSLTAPPAHGPSTSIHSLSVPSLPPPPVASRGPDSPDWVKRQPSHDDDPFTRAVSLPALISTTPRAPRTLEGTIQTPQQKSCTNSTVLPPPPSAHKTTPNQNSPANVNTTPNRRSSLHFRSVKNNRNLQSTRLLHARSSPKTPSKTPATLSRRSIQANNHKRGASISGGSTLNSPIKRPLTR
jgi:mitosis inhibitor protein kinase SWE1